MALRLGIPVGEMLSRMDSAELTEWMAFMQLESRGGEEVNEDDIWKKAFNCG